MRRVPAFLLPVLHALLLAPVSAQQGDSPAAQALRLTADQAEGLEVDGLLSEEFWREAIAISDFRQQEPIEGAQATERTEVRVALDGSTLYVGVMAWDASPEAVVGRILQRDRLMEGDHSGLQFAGDDGVAILLDPFHDHRNAFVFATNPNGAEFEALITDEGAAVNVDWRAVWEVAAARTPEGWSAEFAIPLRTLRYPAGEEKPWGFNVIRTVRRKNEVALWQSWSRDNEGFARVSRAGHLTGMQDLPRYGMNLEVKPFALVGSRWERDLDGRTPTTGQREIGLDLKSEVRPGLVLDLTFNTDFAQVEVDDAQINLTRFSLFYPEKRDFFLENSGIFDMGYGGGWGPPPYRLFFSRRIGIGSAGAIPILGGGRLTGRLGAQTVGFLNVVTDGTDAAPQTNWSVARVKRDVGENNFVGWMVTDRRDRDGSNTVAAVDGSFWPHPTLNAQGFFTRSFTSGAGGEGSTYAAVLDWTTDLVGGRLQHLTVGSEARADMGFILRPDIRETSMHLRVSPRPGRWGVRVVEIRTNGEYASTTDGRLQDWESRLSFGPEFESGDRVQVSVSRGRTVLDAGFDLADSVFVDAGRYDTRQIRLELNSSQHRALVARMEGSWEDFYDGTLRSVGSSLAAAPSPQIALEVAHQWNHVEVPNGAFTANVTSLRFGYAFSTRLTTNALVQYNSLGDDFTANLRLNFIHRPGSDLFLVLTEHRGVDGDPWSLVDRGLVAKVTYLLRL